MSRIVCVLNSDRLSVMREFLDFVLGISAFNEDVVVIFAENSLGLIKNIDKLSPEGTGERNFVKTFGMLELYDISQIYAESNHVDGESTLFEGTISSIPEIRTLSTSECMELIRETDNVFTF
ncbi:DsrE family protein [uncultured Ruminobacter sp.]|uniref:DsrE family protein n=1 Tax=Ruminobacter sp. TaxID=2774296 RepID=UPI00261CD06E|nr:DsrE family protein [uncultured Ruminobacter sp.]